MTETQVRSLKLPLYFFARFTIYIIGRLNDDRKDLTMTDEVKDTCKKVIKVMAVVMTSTSYGFTCATQAVVYALTKNEDVRNFADYFRKVGKMLVIGASNIDK